MFRATDNGVGNHLEEGVVKPLKMARTVSVENVPLLDGVLFLFVL